MMRRTFAAEHKRSSASVPNSACTSVQVFVLPFFCPFAQVLFPRQPVTLILEVSASRMHSHDPSRSPHKPDRAAQPKFAPHMPQKSRKSIATLPRLEFPVSYRKHRYMTISN